MYGSPIYFIRKWTIWTFLCSESESRLAESSAHHPNENEKREKAKMLVKCNFGFHIFFGQRWFVLITILYQETRNETIIIFRCYYNTHINILCSYMCTLSISICGLCLRSCTIVVWHHQSIRRASFSAGLHIYYIYNICKWLAWASFYNFCCAMVLNAIDKQYLKFIAEIIDLSVWLNVLLLSQSLFRRGHFSKCIFVEKFSKIDLYHLLCICNTLITRHNRCAATNTYRNIFIWAIFHLWMLYVLSNVCIRKTTYPIIMIMMISYQQICVNLSSWVNDIDIKYTIIKYRPWIRLQKYNIKQYVWLLCW